MISGRGFETKAGRRRAPATLAAALRAVHEARFSDAAGLLEADEAKTPGAQILLARIKVKKEPAQAIGYLTKILPQLAGTDDAPVATMLLGVAQARVGDVESAQRSLLKAQTALEAQDAPSADVADEIVYQRAASAWMARRLDDADRELAPLLERRPPERIVEALVLAGLIAAARERFNLQGAILLDALRMVLTTPDPDVYLWAHVTAQLAYLARELPNRSIRDAVYAQVGRIPWTADLGELHFKTLKATGWRRALDGDYLNAFRLIKAAAEVAPTDSWRVVASCDRAYLAKNLGERRFAELELQEATDLADSIAWRGVAGEERIALLLLAELHAPADSSLALSFIARYHESGDRFALVQSANADRRVGATIDFSLGYVQSCLGNADEALLSLERSWEVFSAAGYDWRAGRAAIELARLTGRPQWDVRAREKLAAYPRSWIVEQLGSVTSVDEAADSVRLTPAQREVYALLKQGLSTRQITDRLQRSLFTVRNHIKAVLKAYGVNSRSALLSLSMRNESAARETRAQ